MWWHVGHLNSWRHIFKNMQSYATWPQMNSNDSIINCANSLYGKIAESVRKHIDLRIVQTRAGFDRCASQPDLHRELVFNVHSVGVQMTKINIKLTKLIVVGFAILEHAKRRMHEFHELMTTKFFERDKITLCHTDTDSLLYEIHDDDLFAKLAAIRSHWLDTSNYPPAHPLHSALT